MLELTRQKRQKVLAVIEVDQYQFIGHAYAIEGLSQREIARKLGVSRNTKAPQRSFPVSGPVKHIIAEYLEEYRQNNLPKQRHTAKRIYDRLGKQ